jgi:hypothetical protein
VQILLSQALATILNESIGFKHNLTPLAGDKKQMRGE